MLLAIKRYRKSLENIEKSSGSAIIELSKKIFRDEEYYQKIIDNLDINNDKSHWVTKEQTQKYVDESVAAYLRLDSDVTIYVFPSGASVINHKEKLQYNLSCG